MSYLAANKKATLARISEIVKKAIQPLKSYTMRIYVYRNVWQAPELLSHAKAPKP